MSTKLRCGVSLLLIGTVGCATSGRQPADQAPEVRVESQQVAALLGASGEDGCIFTEQQDVEDAGLLAVLGAVVIPKLVDAGVGALGDYLERKRDQRAEELIATYAARAAGELYDREGLPAVRCMMIARGERGVALGNDGDIWTQARLRRFGLAKAPDFFLELEVRLDSRRTAMRLMPVRLEFRQSAARRLKVSKDILVTGFFEQPFSGLVDEEGGGGKFGQFELYFTDVSRGTILSTEELKNFSTQWIPLPSPGPIDEAGVVASTGPVSVLVNVTEAEETADLLLGVVTALSAAVAEENDTISEAVAEEILKQLGIPADDEEKEDSSAGSGQDQ